MLLFLARVGWGDTMKKLKKDVKDFVGLGVMTGVGSLTLAGVGGNVSGLSTMSSFYPVIGTGIMGGAVLRQTEKLYKTKKKKSKKWRY